MQAADERRLANSWLAGCICLVDASLNGRICAAAAADVAAVEQLQRQPVDTDNA